MEVAVGQRARRLKQVVADIFELPRDVVLDLPRVTLVGNLQLHIENHRGLVEYSRETIRVSAAQGEIVVTGGELVIVAILQDEVLVRGRISGVQFR